MSIGCPTCKVSPPRAKVRGNPWCCMSCARQDGAAHTMFCNKRQPTDEARSISTGELAKETYEDLSVLRTAANRLPDWADAADAALYRTLRRMLRASMGGTLAGDAMRQALAQFERDNYPNHHEEEV